MAPCIIFGILYVNIVLRFDRGCTEKKVLEDLDYNAKASSILNLWRQNLTPLFVNVSKFTPKNVL